MAENKIDGRLFGRRSVEVESELLSFMMLDLRIWRLD
jgi:hypothetical protein